MVELTFLGTGSSTGAKGRTNSSLLVDHKILIDCTPDFKEQIKRENVTEIDYLILSHGHSDAIGGIHQLKEFLHEKIPCYCSKETWRVVNEKFKDLDHLEFNEIHEGKEFEIDNIKFTPFRVIHAKDFPCFGFKFEI